MQQYETVRLGVSDFVAYLNQTLEVAYPYVEVQGELSNFRLSKGRWVFFNLKDESASLKCFATVHALPGPLEEGMLVRVGGSPRLHPLYDFSFQVQSIVPVGEGSLRKAADLLAAKLEGEGLFAAERKRRLPYPPTSIALITAGDSAAYADFIKITNARWGGLSICHYNVLVQGEKAPGEIVTAIKKVNEADNPADVVVLVRGGGSAEDLAAWSDERVVRAVAGSRVPTLVAIGHEVDVCLAELAADRRASTPSNAAELLVPDRFEELKHLRARKARLYTQLGVVLSRRRTGLVMLTESLDFELAGSYTRAAERIQTLSRLLIACDPLRPLRQGYALVYSEDGRVISRAARLQPGDTIEVKFTDGKVASQVKQMPVKE